MAFIKQLILFKSFFSILRKGKFINIRNFTPSGQKIVMDIVEGKEVLENLKKMSNKPMQYNHDFLMKVLEDNKGTAYGKKYDFDNIKTIEEYKEKVPITEYDDYIEYILPMSEEKKTGLITNYKINHYSKSSGTLGNPKKLPLSVESEEILMKYLIPYICALIHENFNDLHVLDGKSLNLIEVSLDKLKSGATYGALTAKYMNTFKKFLPYFYTSPFEAFFPEQDTNSRYLHARFGLMDKNIVSIQSAFFNFVLEIFRFIESNWELLVDDIEKGTINQKISLSQTVRDKIEGELEPMPERASELREIFEKGFKTPIIPKIWPKLKIIIGIGTGGFANYAKKIRKMYVGQSINFVLMGLIASEGVFSVPIELNNGNSALIPDSVFYEFRPLDNEDFNSCVTLDKLEIGKDYEIIITNLSGFYRYRMQDAIRVMGMYNNLPLIQFLYRINQTVNLAGEKTTEVALRNALNKTEKEFGFDLVEFSTYPDPDTSPPTYKVFIEAENIPENVSKEDIRDSIEKNISQNNPSFGDKVKKGILGKIELNYLHSETYLLYRDLMVMKGTSSAQLKPPRIIVNEVQRRFFFALIDDEEK
jgi:hypothetical protein